MSRPPATPPLPGAPLCPPSANTSSQRSHSFCRPLPLSPRPPRRPRRNKSRRTTTRRTTPQRTTRRITATCITPVRTTGRPRRRPTPPANRPAAQHPYLARRPRPLAFFCSLAHPCGPITAARIHRRVVPRFECRGSTHNGHPGPRRRGPGPSILDGAHDAAPAWLVLRHALRVPGALGQAQRSRKKIALATSYVDQPLRAAGGGSLAVMHSVQRHIMSWDAVYLRNPHCEEEIALL